MRISVDQHGRVHGSSRRARDPVDPQSRLRQQTVEHAPCEGAVPATALKCKIDQDLVGHFNFSGRGTI
jgi:hypothetical protein